MNSNERKSVEDNVFRYNEYRRYIENPSNKERPDYWQKAVWVWAVDVVRADLKESDPTKEKFFALMYNLDNPDTVLTCASHTMTSLSLKFHMGTSNLFKWRSEIIYELVIAVSQAGLYRRYRDENVPKKEVDTIEAKGNAVDKKGLREVFDLIFFHVDLETKLRILSYSAAREVLKKYWVDPNLFLCPSSETEAP